MENKTNIAELLKDCPMGMELDCVLFEDVRFEECAGNCIYIRLSNGGLFALTGYGNCLEFPMSKCIIFPKGKTTWEGFHRPFEPGDIVITNNNEHAFIYSGENDSFWECYCGVYCGTRNICVNSREWSGKSHNIRLATEEEKEKLFQVIKDNGYKWNAESKTLEKLIAPKFDITTFIPFESRVLVRDSEMGIWVPDFFGCLDNSNEYPYMVVSGIRWKYCIPYEGNEHLLGKCDDCIGFYKNWE